MKNLLYIGNKVSKHGKTATTVETLSVLLEAEGFIVKTTSSKKWMVFRLIDMLWQTLINCKSTDYLLIDTYSTKSFWYAFLCSQLARLLKIKYIPILHGGNLPTRLINNPRLCNLIFKNAYCNVAPSGYLLNAFQNAGFQNVVYIPNVLEIKNYPFINRNFEEPNLLWVRSFADLYNPQMAVKVLHQLQKHYPNATLCMIGPDKDGSLKKSKELAEKLGVHVTFTGKLSKSAWIKFSVIHNIFINTTHFDNTPVSVMEAMALGLPVVSTNVGGMPFLIDNHKTGLLVDDDDVKQMVLAIRNIILNKKRTKEIILNSKQLVDTFDWKVVKKQWIKILK